jgi:hypothetical protein
MILKNKILGAVVVDAAGTSEQITASAISVYAVFIQAEPTNTGKIYVGDSTVTSSNGVVLSPGCAYTIDAKEWGVNEILLSDIYVDAATSGDEVRVQYLIGKGE